MEFGIGFVIIIVVLAWTYDFYNGANDCANSIATTVSTRVLTPLQAVVLAAVLNAVGAFLTTEVAKTIGKGLLPENFMTPAVIMAAIIGAIAWSAFATHKGIPVSITHAIIGGILGAGIAAHGLHAISWGKLEKVVIGMFTSPISGFIVALVLATLLFWIFRNWHPQRANFLFGKAQLVSASFMALTHGMNDTQNAMGVITAALLASGFITSFEVPMWVIGGSALFMGLGTYYGGKKVIHTMGMRIVRLKTVHGFSAETAAAGVIFFASLLGIPISTTHTISAAIMGAGSVRRFSAVRWGVVQGIIIAWIVTIPAAGIVAAVMYRVLSEIT